MREPRLVVVTATANAARFNEFAGTLDHYATVPDVPIVVVAQREARTLTLHGGVMDYWPEYAGVVPAFAHGCAVALQAYPTAEVIACLHDDVLLQELGWDQQLLAHFDAHPNCGLAGFGGAWGLGDEQAGVGTYRPTWLVRRGFMSNMVDAEAHGTRVLEPRKIAVLDGFSQVMRRNFLQGINHRYSDGPHVGFGVNLFGLMAEWGIKHHAYDAALGAFARYLHWDTWLLPFACHHKGGQTAVGDAQYNEWARTQRTQGDQTFWEEAHKIVWDRFGHLLPFEVDRP